LHPTQIYEAAGEMGLFALLLILRHRWKRAPARPPAGALFAVYLIGYALLRFSVEMVRGDAGRRFLATWTSEPLAALLRVPSGDPLFLSTSQVASVGTLVALALIGARRLKHRAAGRSS
jgi:phosphatidylglycerol:prolipoprotein diacylglycerol transferase